MKKLTLTLTAIVAGITLTHGALIDLGPPNNRVIGEYQVPWTSNIASFDGQHLTLDLTFSNDEFVRIFSYTSKSFLVAPVLLLHGTGTIPSITGSGYSVDANGVQNSVTWFYNGGGSTTAVDETFGYGLGYVYPMFMDKTGLPRDDVDALDFYGVHFEITLPNTDDFEILDSGLYFNPSTGDRFRGTWAIGPHVPDTGGTAALFGLSLAALAAFKRR